MIELQTASDSSLEHPTKLNFVEIAFARTRREAALFRGALSDASIAADVESGGNARRGIAVLVESSNLVNATEVLATLAQSSSESGAGYDEEDDDLADEDDDDEFDDEDDDEDYSDDDEDDNFFDDDEDEDDDDYENDDDE